MVSFVFDKRFNYFIPCSCMYVFKNEQMNKYHLYIIDLIVQYVSL